MNLPGLGDLMRQAQEFARQFARLKEELARQRVVGSAGGGMVRVEADGRGRIVKVSIEPQLANPAEREILEDLVCAATNQALEKARELSQQATRSLTGGIALPGIEDLLS